MTFQDDFLQNRNQELVEYMKSSRLFSHIPQTLLEGLVPLSELRVYDPGDDILSEGQENDRVFFLIRGTVQIYSGGEYILELKRQGDIFGEMSVISSKTASATVAAKTRVQVFTLRGRNIGKYTDIDVERINHILYRLFAAVLTDKLALTTYKARQYEVVNIYLNKTQVALAEKHAQLNREKQAAVDIAQAKENFIEHLSCELQTPLTQMIQLAQQMSKTCHTAEQTQQSQLLLQTAQGALDLLTDVIEYSEITSDEGSVENHSYDLFAFMNTLKKKVDSSAQTDEHKIRITLSLDPGSHIYGDPQLLERLLYRVLHRSSSATLSGEVHLQVSQKPGDAGEEIQFVVSSDWGDLSPLNLDELFKPFSELSKEKRKNSSPNLDLAIAKNQVDLLDGRIWLEPKPTQELSICIHVPVHPLPPVSQQNCLIPNSVKVLLFEPNIAESASLVGLLEDWGLAVQLVCDQEALLSTLFSSERYDLLLVSENQRDDTTIPKLTDLRALEQAKVLPIIWFQNPRQFKGNPQLDPLAKVILNPFRKRCLHHNIVELLSSAQSTTGPNEYLARQYPMHILVAEDDQVLQNKLKNHLTNMGYLPDGVSDGAKVIQHCQEYSYDVLILDAHMPVYDGVRVAQVLKETYEKNCPYIIGLCHPVEDKERLGIYKTNFDVLLFKPISVFQLQEYLRIQGQTLFPQEVKSQ